MRSSPFILLVAPALFFAPGPGARAAAPIKVACVGDSITQLSGWPDKLGARLGAGYTSTNDGLAGPTLLKNGDNPYWTSQQFKDSHSANPDIVVIMLGTNDSKPFNWNAHKGEFVGDYEALVDSYAALPSHPKIYLNLCPPAGTNGYQIVGSVIENEIIPDIKQVAVAKGLPTIDVFDAFGGHNLNPALYGSPADLVHPNGMGAQVIADTVYAALTAPPSDGGAGAGGVTDGGSGGANGDASSNPSDAAGSNGDASATVGAGAAGGAGGAAGTTSAAGAAGAGAAGNGNPTGTAGSSSPGAAGAETAGAPGSSGSAGATKPGARASSGGCSFASSTATLPGSSLLVAVAALGLALRRRQHRRR